MAIRLFVDPNYLDVYTSTRYVNDNYHLICVNCNFDKKEIPGFKLNLKLDNYNDEQVFNSSLRYLKAMSDLFHTTLKSIEEDIFILVDPNYCSVGNAVAICLLAINNDLDYAKNIQYLPTSMVLNISKRLINLMGGQAGFIGDTGVCRIRALFNSINTDGSMG